MIELFIYKSSDRSGGLHIEIVNIMFNAKDLTDEQKAQIAEWAAAGDQLNDLQKKMSEAFGSNITYMDTRFAIMDLGIELVKEEEPEPEKEEEPKALVPQGYVDATVDGIVRPGFLASGKVVFSDGMNAVWGLDQMGRLSVDADDPAYQIDDEDMIAFQEVLRDKLKAN